MTPMSEQKSLLLIVGNKRSGSTQIMRLLNLHPHVFVSNETDILWILFRLHNDQEIIPYEEDSPAGMERALDACGHVLSKNKTPYENFIDFQREAMGQGLGHLDPMQKENLLFIGDQKPYQNINPTLLSFAKKHFDDIRLIHPVRHPFTQVHSAMTHGEDVAGVFLWRGMSVKEVLAQWTKYERKVLEEKEKQELPILDVRLEDLKSSTEVEMRRILSFLNLTHSSELLRRARANTGTFYRVHHPLDCPAETKRIMRKYSYSTNIPFYLKKEVTVRMMSRARRYFQAAKRKCLGLIQ